MTAWTTPKTWTAATLTVADMNTEVRDNLKNLDERLTVSGITSPSGLNKLSGAACGVRCQNSTDPTHTSGSDKTLSWDGESYDTDGFHSTSSNTHRITIPAGLDGLYFFWASIQWEINGTGDRQLWIENSTGFVQLRNMARAATSSNKTQQQVSGVLEVAGADWFAAHVMQDSGSTLTTYSDLTSCGFGAWRLFAS